MTSAVALQLATRLQPTTVPPGPGSPHGPALRVLQGGRAPSRLAQQAVYRRRRLVALAVLVLTTTVVLLLASAVVARSAGGGTPVPAAARGRVVFSAELPVRGNAVIIDHGLGVFTLYSHLSQWSVAEGQIVEKGQTIGLVGQTGLATGPHLHWEVVTRGVSVNGLTWTQNDFTP